METLALAVLYGFVCFRIAEFFTVDDGPFDVCKNFKTMLGRLAGRKRTRETLFLAELFNCPFCLGVWVAIPLAAHLANNIAEWFILWWAIAGVQSFVQANVKGVK